MTLQDTFYTLGIIYMVVMLLLIVAGVAGVLAIKAKVNHIHDVIEDKLNVVGHLKDAAATFVKNKTKKA